MPQMHQKRPKREFVAERPFRAQIGEKRDRSNILKRNREFEVEFKQKNSTQATHERVKREGILNTSFK